MARIPHSDNKLSTANAAEEPVGDWPPEAGTEIEEHIREADYWATDWRLRELEFEGESRQAEHRKYIVALHKVCSDYGNQNLKEFPGGIARWLAQEAENVCDDLPSQIFKSPEEGVRTANFVQENQFELIRQEWQKHGQNPAFILQALCLAKEQGVIPPGWVLNSLIEAGSKVYQSDGDVEFGEALRLTPKKIKEARSGQKKVWVADLVAEGIDGGLSHPEARELAIFEAELVFGWRQYKPDTVQRYYENHAGDRDGFGRSFMYSLDGYGSGTDTVYQSIRLLFWRRKALRSRLEAYREAVELYPDTDNTRLDRARRLAHVVSKTVAALRRNQPPTNNIGQFSETEF